MAAPLPEYCACEVRTQKHAAHPVDCHGVARSGRQAFSFQILERAVNAISGLGECAWEAAKIQCRDEKIQATQNGHPARPKLSILALAIVRLADSREI
jgi:hypothetical protein